MQIAICDDDAVVIEEIEKDIQLYFNMNHIHKPDIASFSTGVELLADPGEKDLVFLDIEMPGMNGIFVGKELKKRNPHTLIIVVTSYAEYLDEAMRFHVFRYLSKPLDRNRLFRNLKDALEYTYRFSARIPVETRDGVRTLPASDILCIEAQARKIVVHTIGPELDSIRPMNYWIEQLPKNCFFQSHRSFLVNLEHVTDFDHELIRLDGGRCCAYLTRRKYKTFKDAYLLYLESTR